MASFGENILPDGASITRPPGFSGEHFSFWKAKFRVFVMATEYGLWDVIQDGDYIPMKLEGDRWVKKGSSEFDDNDKKNITLNSKAILMIQSALSQKEYFRICNLSTAKEMWEALEIAHEGTSGIKENRVNTLTTEFDLLRMKAGESIADFELRYTHIINQLAALGKTYEQGVQVRKILNILTSDWEAKVTAIEEARGESMRSVAALFGSLSEYEGKQKFKKELTEIDDKKKKNLALKSIREKESDDEEMDDEEMGLIIRKFKKFYRRDGRRFQKGGPSGKKEGKESIICYECNKPGHFKSECPNLKSKDKKMNRLIKKKAYVSAIWGDSSSDEESDEEETANICLVAQEQSDSETETETEEVTNTEPTYDELLSEYNDLRSEFIKIARELVGMRKKVKTLEEQTAKKNECDSCEKLRDKNLSLTKTLEKFTRGSEMLNIILSSQRCMNDKSGIGYNPLADKRKGKKKRGSKSYLTYFRHSVHTSNPFVKCNFCNKTGHYTSSCYHRKEGVSGSYKWVPKGTYGLGTTNPKGPKRAWVPKT